MAYTLLLLMNLSHNYSFYYETEFYDSNMERNERLLIPHRRWRKSDVCRAVKKAQGSIRGHITETASFSNNSFLSQSGKANKPTLSIHYVNALYLTHNHILQKERLSNSRKINLQQRIQVHGFYCISAN